MKAGSFRLVGFGLLLIFGLFLGVLGQPKLIVSEPTSYEAGSQISSGIRLLDSGMNPVVLRDIIEPDTKLIVLILFGGGAKTIPEEAFRGPLWCRDSFDDLAIQRALLHSFKDAGVQFIPVAVPPVFSSERYGFEDRVFLEADESSPEFQRAALEFVRATEDARMSDILPFEKVYYDPGALLTQAPGDTEETSAIRKLVDWQGKLKWREDPRKYGAPTIWLLDREGWILRKPFWGNDYDSDPPQISYGFADLKEAIEKALSELK